MKPLISVIVPIYKVELYLRQCINSILSQTYQNLEIILVDDGSPDNCPAICDEYAKIDNRIRVIHKKNGGLSDARNFGIEVARGEYIGFVDSDDWIMPDMYEYLYQGIKEFDADIAVCEYYECWNKKRIAKYRHDIRVFEAEQAMEALLYLKIGNYAWNKLYKRELWSKDVRYPKGKLYEDVQTTYKLFEKSNLVVALPEAKYFYRRTDESITGIVSINNKMQSVTSRINRFEILQEQYPNPREFMLKDIYRFVPELRKAICNNSKGEFNKFQDELRDISRFFQCYQNEFHRACKLGPFGSLSYRFMMRGDRIGWKLSAVAEKMVILKAEICNCNWFKKSKNWLYRWKENEKKRYYYNTCSKLPLQKTAFIESRGGEDLAGNMYEIAKELCAHQVKVYLSVKPKNINKVQQILKTGSFSGLEIVEKWTKPYYRAFATSKYWFNDMVFEDLVVKRPGQIYVNTWHGTPLKKLEFDVKDQRNNTGGASRDFLKSDYLAVPSRFLFDILLKSGCVDTVFHGKACYSGYPRNSIFFDNVKRSEVRHALGIDKKEVYVYMPTWRGNLLQHSEISGEYSLEKILDFFEHTLNENQVIFVKLHNYAVGSVDYKKYKKVIAFPAEYDAYSVLNIADCLITDYSSVFFDYANTKKKIILFTYDKEEYLRDRGLYFELEELPFPKVNNFEELAEELNIHKNYDDSSFIQKFCTYDCVNSAQKLVDFIIEQKDSCETETMTSNGKRNILLYDSEIQNRGMNLNDIDKLLLGLNTEDVNYFYCYSQWLMKSTPIYLKEMNPKLRMFTLTKNPISLWPEKILMKLTRKRVLMSQVKRELNRQFSGNVFDEVHVLGDNKDDQFARIFNKLNKVN